MDGSQEARMKVLPGEFRLYKEPKYEKKFAYLPIRSTIGNYKIWLTEYYVKHTFYDQLGRPPIKGLSWKLVMTKEQYFIFKLEGKI